ncbi:MAG: translocation/assembly module TamB domain-containing protein [Pseudomonadota bacterium]
MDPQPAPARRLRWPWVAALGLTLLLALLLAAAVAWLAHSPRAVALSVRAIDALLPERITATGIRGAFATGIEIDELRIEVDDTVVVLSAVRGSIESFAPLSRHLTLAELSAERVAIRLPPVPSPGPAQVPARIAAPLTIDAHALRIGEFAIERARPVFKMNAIDASVAFGPRGTEVRRFAADIAGNRLTAVGTLGPARPFPIDAGGTLVSRLVVGGSAEAATVDAPVQATWRALDSLEQLQLNAGVTGGPGYAARGALRLRIAPFAPDALQSLDADLAGLDPAAWLAGAPQADLQVQAQLQPVPGATFTLSGPIQVSNRRPGPVDDGRIPLRELRGHLTARAGALAVDDAQALLARGAASGQVSVNWEPPTAARWKVDARLDGVDPATIHTRAQSMSVDGRLAAQSRDDGTRVQVQLRARAAPGRPPFSLDAALRIDAERIALEQGRLRLDGGYAQLTGELSRRNAHAFSVSGTLRDLNPGLIVKGADARLNGELRAEGVLRPTPRATLHASLADSVLLGRPLRGRVDARWLGDEDVRIDADLAVRSATIAVHGGFGTGEGGSVRNVEVAVNAPAVEELGLPLRGAVEARATLSGAWHAPAIDASVEASRIVYAGQRIGRLSARLRHGGGADGAFEASIALREHRHPRGDSLSVADAQLSAVGTLREHRLTVSARTATGVPLAAALAGGCRDEGRGGAWRGQVESASAGGALDAVLAAPADLAVGADGARFGPAQFRAGGARVTDARLLWRQEGQERVIESSGAFDDLVLAATAGPGETPLALRGEWSLRAARSLDARVLIERTAGDVHTGSAARRARMGLTQMRAEVQVRGNRLDARAVARGSEVGAVTAGLRAEAESDGDGGWRLAQQRPWSGELQASVPSLAWINPFLSANLRESIRVGGSAQANLQLSGTPAAPRASGFIHADGLRVAWIEQGVRLENGVVRARLESADAGTTEVVFDSVSFTGPPRFVPDDRRIRQALGAEPSGRLDANGRLKLPALEGVVQVQLVRFPLVQRRDRWAVGTGGANMVFSPKRVRLDGALVADAGYIDIARPTVPSLSDDVVVVRAADATEARREATAPRVAFDFDFGIDLGSAFVLRGNGVDTRLVGALRVRHEGRGVIRATGAVEARDGTYEGYGQKLVIERGRINFQGPLDNPGLDILALRKGLPVEVGVTITRTAANPLVRLYSDPPQTDFDTLSWLVLGRPAEASRGDSAALARAAVGLLGGSGEGVPTQLARRLGIDEFSIRTADIAGSGSLLPRQSVAGRVRGDAATLGGEIVSIGKRLSEELTLSYEQATTGTSNVVQLSYRLTQRLSVIARAGTENALDLVYSFAFD